MLTVLVVMNQKQFEMNKIKDVMSSICYSNSFGFGIQ